MGDVTFSGQGETGDITVTTEYRVDREEKALNDLRKARQKDKDNYTNYVNGMLKIAKAYYVEGQKIEGVDKTKTAKPKSDKSDADRANRESLEALKQQYKDQKDAIENKYKLQLKAVEDNIKLAKDDPYLSSVEKPKTNGIVQPNDKYQ